MKSPPASGTSKAITRSPTSRALTRNTRRPSRSSQQTTTLGGLGRAKLDCTISAACKSSRFSTEFHKFLQLPFKQQLAHNDSGYILARAALPKSRRERL